MGDASRQDEADAVPESEPEIEYKFTAPNPDLLAHLPDLLLAMDARVGPPERRNVRDVYLDTPDWWFYRGGLACRIRRENGDAALEFKTLAPIREGIAVREEFRESLPAMPEQEIKELPGTRLRAWVAPLMLDPCVEAKGALEQSRAIYRVASGDGLLMDVSADRVRTAGGRFGQIEMELVEGDREALAAFAKDFGDRYGLPAERLSKFRQAVRAFGNLTPEAPRDEDAPLLPRDRFVDAAYKILSREWARLLWNEPGARLGLDAEYLHDMRVATRRMRAALRVFRDALPPRRLQWLKRNLQWLGRALGAVRDLDVSLLGYGEMSARIPERYRAGLKRYREELEKRRAKARTAMIRTLNTRRFHHFAARVGAFLKAGPPRKPRRSPAGRPIATVAPGLIRRLMKRVRKEGRSLDERSEDGELHALRIRCKRLRYACEFFAELYGKPAQTFVRRVKRLQTILGEHQDAVLAQQTLDTFARTVRAPRAEAHSASLAAGQLIAHEIRRAARTRRRFVSAWKKYDRKRTGRPLEAALDRVESRVQGKRAH